MKFTVEAPEKAAVMLPDNRLVRHWWQTSALLLITLLAGALRFYHLGEWSYWRDETYTLLRAVDLASVNYDYPIWYLVTLLSVSVFGVDEWSARLPAAVIGTLAIPLTYVFLRRLWGASSALIAALLLAVSPWHLYWSQNARFYVLMSLLATLALLIFFVAIEEDRPLHLLVSLALIALAALTHPTGFLVVGALAAYLVLVGASGGSRPAGVNRRNLAILAGVAVGPVIYMVWRVLRRPAEFAHFVQSSTIDYLWLPSAAIYYLGVPLICMAAVGALYALARRDRLAILLTLAAVIPTLMIVVASTFSFGASRYLFVAAVPWIILAARGASELAGQLRGKATLLGIGVVALLAAESLSEDFLYYRYQNGNRPNYKGAYQLVKEQMRPGDYVLASSPEMGPFFLIETPTLSVWDTDLAALAKEGRRSWYVTDMRLEDTEPRVATWVRQNTTLMANLDVNVRARNYVMRVYLFDPDNRHLNQALMRDLGHAGPNAPP